MVDWELFLRNDQIFQRLEGGLGGTRLSVLDTSGLDVLTGVLLVLRIVGLAYCGCLAEGKRLCD